jgi:hypothetical protein
MPTAAAGAPRVTVKKIGRIGYTNSLAASCKKLTPHNTRTLDVNQSDRPPPDALLAGSLTALSLPAAAQARTGVAQPGPHCQSPAINIVTTR